MLPLDHEAYAADGDMTPIERRGAVWVKRDDLYSVAGAPGGKARTCWQLAQGAPGLITASSRSSPQMNIVARIGAKLGIPTCVHCPGGPDTPELAEAKHWGMRVITERPGYNSVIVARAKRHAEATGDTYIPFGMECGRVQMTMATQVKNLPPCKRVVIPVGSGMSLAGLLYSHPGVPVLGVCVGANPVKRLDAWAPGLWRNMATLVDAGIDYHKPAPVTCYEGLELDPVYEAKCIPFLQPDDLLWVVGIRSSSVAPQRKKYSMPQVEQGD